MRLVLLFGLFLSETYLFADEPSVKNVAVEVRASFGNFDSPLRRLTVSLGELPADEHIDATIKLVNVTQSPIEFLTLRTSCNCLNAKVLNSNVDPTKSADVLATLHTRLRSFSPDQVTTFQVETKQEGRVEKSTISIEYTLKGVLAFPFPSFHHEIPVGSKSAELRLPLLVTDPIVGSKIEVDSELTALPEMVHDTELNDKWWIVLPVDPSLLQKDISLFKVKVSDPVTGRGAETTVSLERAAAFRVSPRTLRFSRSGEDGNLFATSIISVAGISKGKEASSIQKQDEDGGVLLATATVEGKPVRVRVEPLGKDVFRVETCMHEDALPLDRVSEFRMHWSFMYGESKGDVTSLFAVDSQ